MEKKLLIILTIFILTLIGSLIYLSQKNLLPSLSFSKKSNWKYEKTIEEPIFATSTSSEDVTLGNLEKNKVSVVVSKGAFDQDQEIKLANPNKVPSILENEIDTIGAPIEIDAGENKRLNEKATITFAYDKTLLPEGTQESEMRVAYYNGENWDYIKPTAIDFEAGTMTFDTYHFSLLGANRIKDETKITEAWIHSQALDNKLKGDFNDMSDEVAGKVVDLMLEKMGISDKSIKGQILGDILKDDGYKEIYDAYQSGDVAGFNQKVAIMAGSKIANNVPSSVLSEALGGLGDAAEDIAAVSKAAGYMAEGQYKDAAKILGEQIADKFLITTATKIAVEVVDGQIQSWKNSEIEAAFKAYSKGANGYFYGYNVDPDDFNGVWDQMRGIRRQLELEAIKKENDIRKDSGMPELSERQMDNIRANVKRTYEKQFSQRKKQEEELNKEEEKLAKIMKAFEEANFFGGIPPKELDKGYTLETRLEIVNHFVEKMMKDINRFELTDKKGLIVEGKVNVEDLVLAGRFYFGEDGKQKYREYLNQRFGIPLYPNLSELKGSWSGTMTINKIEVDQAMLETLKEELEASGCDVNEINQDKMTEMEGKTQPINLTINPNSETGGEMSFVNDGETNNTPFTYNNGVISASMTENEAVTTITLSPTGSDGSYSASGTMNANFKDVIKMNGSLSVTKK